MGVDTALIEGKVATFPYGLISGSSPGNRACVSYRFVRAEFSRPTGLLAPRKIIVLSIVCAYS